MRLCQRRPGDSPSCPAAHPKDPNLLPELEYTGKEDSGNFTRYKLTVTNRDNYPMHLFKPSPDLPPIGLNAQASRTLIEIYTASNERIYGFAALRSGADLDRLWFAVRKGAQAPAQVYIVVHDRQLNRFYKSNLVDIDSKVGPGG